MAGGRGGERLRAVGHTGSIDASPEWDPLFQGALASARLHGLAHEVLTGAEVNARFPGYRLPEQHRAVFQPDGGLIASERAVVAHITLAQAAGAMVRARERVLGWEAGASGEGVTVITERGRYEAGRLVLTAGAWMGEAGANARWPRRGGAAGAGLAAATSAGAVQHCPAFRCSIFRSRKAAITACRSMRCRASSSAVITIRENRASRDAAA